MKPTQTLPENFNLAWNLELKHNTRLNIILQIIGLGWMALAGWLLAACVLWMRPELVDALNAGISGNLLIGLLLLIVVMAVTITLHELVHGLFFWLFAGRRPEFGIGTGYAFAAMPDWYFPKLQYLVIGLSPLVLLTGLGLLLSAFVPLSWLAALLAGMVINAGGAIGDIYVCWRIALDAPELWIKDTGDGFQLYRRGVE
jgi:hypothetical protein